MFAATCNMLKIGSVLKRTFSTALSKLPTEVDAVVIGGGSIGCNTLYHLTTLGLTNCILIERDKITSGTTWHTAGLLWRLRPSDVDVELMARTRLLNRDILEQETGQSTGWIENGGLFIANNVERLNEYKRLMTLGKCYGVESFVLTPSETKKLYPLMNIDDLYGTLYSPKDGLIDPTGLCNNLIRAAQKRGAKVAENCKVTHVRTCVNDMGTKCVESVVTDRGTIKTKVVVNCAGAWGRKIGRMAGVNVPLIAMKHAYVITDKIDGIRNMPNVRDHDASVYLKLQGDALAVGGYEPNPIFCDDVKDDFAFSLFDLDWDVFSVHIKGAVNRVPILKNVGIKSEICGPESFTPDHKALIGESPEVRGFFLGCGFNSAGMMLGGGCGQQLAQWIVHGRPELHMYSYDIRRFASQLTNDNVWIRERSHESYANNYQIVFPYDEPLAGRPKRTDPLYPRLLEQGCVFQERLGWERPAWFATDGKTSPMLPYDYYGSYGHSKHQDYIYKQRVELDHTFELTGNHNVIDKECRACRTGVAVFDMSYFGKFYLTGPDSQKAVDWIFTNDLHKPVGSTVYTCMLNDRGGVEADLTVSVLEPGDGHAVCGPKFQGRGFYIAAGGGISEHVWRHIEKEIDQRKFNVQLLDVTDQMSMISVQGPKSRKLLEELLNVSLSDESLPFSSHRMFSIGNDRVCRIIRLSFVGELGYELHVPNENALSIYDTLMSAGKKYDIKNAGYRAIDALSIEKGYRLWGTDLRSSDTPLEAGLGFTCKLKSTLRFKGRPVLEEQKLNGLKKKMICLTLNDHKSLWGLEAIYRNDKVVGFLRRADYAFTLEKTIVHGYVRAEDGQTITQNWLKDGTYEIEAMGDRFSAVLHLISPFDPKNKRLQGIYDQ